MKEDDWLRVAPPSFVILAVPTGKLSLIAVAAVLEYIEDICLDYTLGTDVKNGFPQCFL